MRVPNTVNENCLKAYQTSIQNYWDWKIPKSLRETCIEHIARNWAENSILDEIIVQEDRQLLLDILPEFLPLELTLPKIDDEIYWKKCFAKRWPQLTSKFAKMTDDRTSKNVRDEKKTWKKHYCEMHVKNYLEKLKPEDYDPEKIKELCDLCSPHVENLEISEMISSENSPNKIPLNAIVTGLANLTEISLTFKQTYANENFSWNIVTTSYQDVSLFARGLERIRLRKLRITNSDIDCDKALIILKSLLKHDLEILDFSHCKVGDRGAIALAKFSMENDLEELYLANNRIGSKGVNCLAYALARHTSKIKTLDLRLNQFLDDAGNVLINSIFSCNKSMKNLSISGCGLTSNFQLATALNSKSYLETLNLSNNFFDEEFGLRLLEALKCNKSLKKLDLRMCKIPSGVEARIHEEIHRNCEKFVEDFEKEISEIDWDENLIEEIDGVFVEESLPLDGV